MKKQILLSVVILAGLLCCSCINNRSRYGSFGGGGSAIIPPEQHDINSEQTISPENIPSEEQGLPVQPYEDPVHVFASDNIAIIDTFNGSPFSIFSQNINGVPKYGIISMDGTIMLNGRSSLGWCEVCGCVYDDTLTADDTKIHIAEGHYIEYHWGHGGFYNADYIYDDTADIMLEYWAEPGYIEIKPADSIKTFRTCKVYRGSQPVPQNGFNVFLDWENEIPNPEFNHVCELFDNLSEYGFMSVKGELVKLGVCEYVPEYFTNDYIVVKCNGKYGYYKNDGSVASQFVYEDAKPAAEGKAWVKLDGKWRVIKLG